LSANSTSTNFPHCVLLTEINLPVSKWVCGATAGQTWPISINPAITISKGTSSSNNARGGKPNVGAIAGGVVGGALATVAVGAIAIFVLSRRKKAATPPHDQPPYQPGVSPVLNHQQQPPMQPMHSGGYGDQQWKNQVYSSPPPQMQQQYQDNTPVSIPPQQNGQATQPECQQPYEAQHQGNNTEPPRQLNTGPTPLELPAGH